MDSSPRPKGKGPYPYHTEQFPYQRTLDALVTRRRYLRLLVLTSLGLFLGNLGIAARALFPVFKAAPRVRVARVQAVPAGQAISFSYPRSDVPAILINVPGIGFNAFAQTCTHLACPVLWSPERGRLECPCHDGAFDPSTGLVISGPPPRRLPRIHLETAEGYIYAVGKSP